MMISLDGVAVVLALTIGFCYYWIAIYELNNTPDNEGNEDAREHKNA
jgi:hypothetical protein